MSKLDTTIVTLADFSDCYGGGGYGDFFYNYNFGDFCNGEDFIIFWKTILTTQRYFSGRRISLHSDTNTAKNIANIIAEILAEIIAKNMEENYSEKI